MPIRLPTYLFIYHLHIHVLPTYYYLPIIYQNYLFIYLLIDLYLFIYFLFIYLFIYLPTITYIPYISKYVHLKIER
jgi:hypothetical protein